MKELSFKSLSKLYMQKTMNWILKNNWREYFKVLTDQKKAISISKTT